MGFGSYDESEQQQQAASDDDEDAAVNVHENEYEGEMTVETGESTETLIGRLQEIKENEESEAE